MRLAVVDDENIVRSRLQKLFAKEGHVVETFGNGEDFLERVKVSSFDLVFLDVVLPGVKGTQVFEAAKVLCPDMEVIFMTGYASIDAAIDAVKLGAFHYVSKPFKLSEIRLLAEKAMEHKSLVEENTGLRARLQSCGEPPPMIGMSPVIKELFGMIAKVAPLNCNVLIQGESGTGKELVARSIYEQSLRKDKPFVAFNCAGFTEELISSELFGYERGSFTGATSTKIGILETADGGTVFMDEIGDMPLSMQAKLLRVIQERQIRRVGATKSKELDLRFVAATNKDLKRAVQDGDFRDDLYFRLKVVQLDVPSLAQRKEDIPILIRHFAALYSRQFSKPVRRVDPSALDILLTYSYPGNVRELENIVERAVALADGETITVRDLPPELREQPVSPQREWLTLEEQEREYLQRALASTNFNLGRAAQLLDLPRTTLWRKMKRYGISKEGDRRKE